jgi:hypothetical protein
MLFVRFLKFILIIAFIVSKVAITEPVFASNFSHTEKIAFVTSEKDKHELIFSDNSDFYKKLAVILKNGEAASISTEYSDYFYFPYRLQEIFKMEQDNPQETNPHREREPSTKIIPATLNPKPLETFAMSALGCGVGAVLGTATCGGIEVITKEEINFSECEKKSVALFTFGGCLTGFVSTVGSYNYRVEIGKLDSSGLTVITLTPRG